MVSQLIFGRFCHGSLHGKNRHIWSLLADLYRKDGEVTYWLHTQPKAMLPLLNKGATKMETTTSTAGNLKRRNATEQSQDVPLGKV
jgi:hypothetical protein